MNREIERGNNSNLTNLLTLLGNVFPHEQQSADATLHQALIAATAHVTQRDVPPRRTELKDQPLEEDSYKHCKNKRKHYYEQREPEPWERVLRSVAGMKVQVRTCSSCPCPEGLSCRAGEPFLPLVLGL